jgi:hypothetical protein
MKRRRSWLVLIAVLALVVGVTVGLATGTAAAKKKHKKSGRVTVSRTTPTTIPGKPSANANDTLTVVPLTVGKKAKGKIVSFDSIAVTTTFSGPTPAAISAMRPEITAPNGRSLFLFGPAASSFAGNTTSGPLTETANSPFNLCFPGPTTPCPGGSGHDPQNTVGPPFVGTIGNSQLARLAGVPAKGTWRLQVLNGGTTTGTLNSVSLSIPLVNAVR